MGTTVQRINKFYCRGRFVIRKTYEAHHSILPKHTVVAVYLFFFFLRKEEFNYTKVIMVSCILAKA